MDNSFWVGMLVWVHQDFRRRRRRRRRGIDIECMKRERTAPKNNAGPSSNNAKHPWRFDSSWLHDSLCPFGFFPSRKRLDNQSSEVENVACERVCWCTYNAWERGFEGALEMSGERINKGFLSEAFVVYFPALFDFSWRGHGAEGYSFHRHRSIEIWESVKTT